MNATGSMLFLVSTLAIGVTPATQTTNPSKISSRLPVDVSLQSLGETRGGTLELSAPPTVAAVTRFTCVPSIRDQATSGCLEASSVATSGKLFPYPGVNNTFFAPAFVGGGQDNNADYFATVGGGALNNAGGPYSVVGGGRYNFATGYAATVGGGIGNWASTHFLFIAATTVAGGNGNTAVGAGSTVGGGVANNAGTSIGSLACTVGGGTYNTASGYLATVPGGHANSALGDYSFAAGRRAMANHHGSFVWGDSFDGDKASSTVDEFNIYASGGVRMFTNSAATTGVLLAPGGSTWTMVSDRDAKENVEPVDARAVLDKVAELRLATWNYKAQDDSIRHMGPMAQDFYAAFGLGLGEKTIDTIDPNGVALAAIQGLNTELEERLAEKDEEIEKLRAANEALLARVVRLEELTQLAMAR